MDNNSLMSSPTTTPRHIKDIKDMANKYLSSFPRDILSLRDADTNTWQALSSNFLMAMNNAARLASECYYAKEWYSSRGEMLKDESKKRESLLYVSSGLEKLAATARNSQLKIICHQDGEYIKIRSLIHVNSQIVAEFASYEMNFKSIVSQADNAHVTARAIGKMDTDVMRKM